jgi:hypothetical protein
MNLMTKTRITLKYICWGVCLVLCLTAWTSKPEAEGVSSVLILSLDRKKWNSRTIPV